MQGLLDKIEQAIREFFIGLIESNLTTMFVDVNEKTAQSPNRSIKLHKAGTAISSA
ncbi:MAG: hypothetical protein GX625_15620 [Clostridiaceae bacterium]|jgi:hypothetical protein|nr:hypothetical protein [Brevefilum fermentans]MDD2522958.1 hypothetical protein [Anaerolineaceae bacterium]NLE26737.1 hypothetical protein [Clostridiaceae bacterium]